MQIADAGRSVSISAIAVLVAAVIPTACGMESAAGGSSGHGATAPGMGSAPSLEELGNATFTGVFDGPVTLVDGVWEGAPYVDGGAARPRAGLVEHFTLSGDLDGDDLDETVVLLWESSGGSGTRIYLAAVERLGSGVVNLATALVGDRVQIEAASIADGAISLDLIQAGPGEAACCPTQKALVTWRLEDGALVRVATEITGNLSLEDLRGPDWVLAAIGSEGTVPDDPPIRIRFVEDRVDGSAGCNSYFGTVTGETPGRLGFSAMGTTMMACSDPVMDLERQYLRTLAGGSTYRFSAGRLVIGCDTDEGQVPLIFERRDATGPAVEGGS